MHANIDTLFRFYGLIDGWTTKSAGNIYNQIGLKVCDTIHITKYTHTERERVHESVWDCVYERERGRKNETKGDREWVENLNITISIVIVLNR